MAIRKIRTEEDPILRKMSKEVDKIDNKIIQLLDDMRETMFEEDGVGLAAVQVGVLKRIFIACFGEYSDENIFECINPVIYDQSGEQIGPEGCLSVPDKSFYRKRPKTVVLRYTDRNGDKSTIELTGFNAVLCMHEYEHLNGRLYTDDLLSKDELDEYLVSLPENEQSQQPEQSE